jgi:hypothetical protein
MERSRLQTGMSTYTQEMFFIGSAPELINSVKLGCFIIEESLYDYSQKRHKYLLRVFLVIALFNCTCIVSYSSVLAPDKGENINNILLRFIRALVSTRRLNKIPKNEKKEKIKS